jgi:hypothetical protein
MTWRHLLPKIALFGVIVRLSFMATFRYAAAHSIKPERPDIAIRKGTFNPATRRVHLEADVPNPRQLEAASLRDNRNHRRRFLVGRWEPRGKERRFYALQEIAVVDADTIAVN